MKAFIITVLCIHIVGLLVKLGVLAFKDYPYTIEYERWGTVVKVIFTLGWIGWCIYLLT